MRGRLSLAKEDIELKLLEIVTSIHTFGGSIMIGAISLSGNNILKLKSNPLLSILFGIGLTLFFLTFWFIKNSYLKNKGRIDFESIDRSFYMSLATMGLFLVVLLTITFS
ncbi:MAG: hypothetical protein NC827_09425 [Candidatus Omnitrophica bacterium]|nr:hypothetical protein [Candidatus Omnitrophota bacterium]